MEVHKIDTSNRKEVLAFFRLPLELDKTEKRWVPPYPGYNQVLEQWENLPLFHSDHVVFFLVYENNKAVGRIGVADNLFFPDPVEEGFIFLFDCLVDENAIHLLLQACEDWSTSHKLSKLIGPIDLFGAKKFGLLCEGFNSPALQGVPFTSEKVPELLINNGYAKYSDYFTGVISQPVSPKYHQIAARVRSRNHFTLFTPTSENEYVEWLPKCKNLSLLGASPTFPSQQDQFLTYAKNTYLQSNLDSLSILQFGDEIAGYFLILPDIAASLQKTHGRSDFLSVANQRIERNNSHLFSLEEYYVHPAYFGLGANILLSDELSKFLLMNGKSEIAVLQIPETDKQSIEDFEQMGTNWIKRHRLFTKNI